MKRFLIKVTKLILLTVLIISIITLSYKYKASNIEIPKQYTTIILGDSHTETALNDSLIDSSINISQSSEHYLYTYNKLIMQQLTLFVNTS